MAADNKQITIDSDYTITDVLRGESLDIQFDLSDIFGVTINPADWTDVIIYLYHKYSKVNVGYSAAVDTWSKIAVTVSFAGDVAEITMTHDRLASGQVGLYKYSIELVAGIAHHKAKGDCFNLLYAIDE